MEVKKAVAVVGLSIVGAFGFAATTHQLTSMAGVASIEEAGYKQVGLTWNEGPKNCTSNFRYEWDFYAKSKTNDKEVVEGSICGHFWEDPVITIKNKTL